MEGAKREGEGRQGGHRGEQRRREFGGGGDHGEHRSKAAARGRPQSRRLRMCCGQPALVVGFRGRGRGASVPVAILGQQQGVRDVRVMSESTPPGNVSKACVSAACRFPLGGIVVQM